MLRLFGLDRLYLAIVLAAHVIFAAWSILSEDAVSRLAQEVLPFVQLALLAFWLFLGPGGRGLRLAGAALLFATLWTWSLLSRWWPGQEVFPLGLCVIVMAGVTGVALRLFGLRIRQPGAGSLSQDRPTQYSLRFLLIATTVCCLLLVMGKWVYSVVSPGDSSFELLPLVARGTLAFGLAGVSLAAIAVVLASRRPFLFSMILLPLAACVGCGLAIALHRQENWISLSLWMTAQTLLVAGTLAPLRNLGYRLGSTVQPSLEQHTTGRFRTFQVKHESITATP